jgi:predicted ABC-class ATPase
MCIAAKHGIFLLSNPSVGRLFVYNSCASVSVVAFCDYINRQVASLVCQWRLDVADSSGNYHGPKGGDFNIYKPRQQILERSSCVITGLPRNNPSIEIRFTVTLPAHGRSINGRKAQELLVTHLPKIMERGLLWEHQDEKRVRTHLRTMEVQESLRNSLAKLGLVAFVGNESILPRANGADPGPMKESVIAFQSPPSLEVTIATGILDHAGQPISITGMGIPRGITVITGGGFHGKSTLLEALQFGIYNVVPGDGRELVVTERNAFKVRAEDGRSVVCTDISPFINKLPGGKSAASFTTMDASGSTSMSANIQEALVGPSRNSTMWCILTHGRRLELPR